MDDVPLVPCTDLSGVGYPTGYDCGNGCRCVNLSEPDLSLEVKSMLRRATNGGISSGPVWSRGDEDILHAWALDAASWFGESVDDLISVTLAGRRFITGTGLLFLASTAKCAEFSRGIWGASYEFKCAKEYPLLTEILGWVWSDYSTVGAGNVVTSPPVFLSGGTTPTPVPKPPAPPGTTSLSWVAPALVAAVGLVVFFKFRRAAR
jgi:hypothetical protein